jgi:Flp pilus assembly pilin Flp
MKEAANFGGGLIALLSVHVRGGTSGVGQTYGLIAAGISIAIILAVQNTGTTVKGTFNSVAKSPEKLARVRIFACVSNTLGDYFK